MDDGHYKFQVEWNTGEITWEPAQYLREDAPGNFAEYLRRSGLSKLGQFAWANVTEQTTDAAREEDTQDGEKSETSQEQRTDIDESSVDGQTCPDDQTSSQTPENKMVHSTFSGRMFSLTKR